MIERKRARQLVQGFATCRVLVVGDLMLDRYVWGSGISSPTGVPSSAGIPSAADIPSEQPEMTTSSRAEAAIFTLGVISKSPEPLWRANCRLAAGI